MSLREKLIEAGARAISPPSPALENVHMRRAESILDAFLAVLEANADQPLDDGLSLSSEVVLLGLDGLIAALRDTETPPPS